MLTSNTKFTSQDKEGTTEKKEFNIKLLPKSLTYAKLFILAKDPLLSGRKYYIYPCIYMQP